MNNIKKLFTENLVEPAADSRRSSTIIGEVIKVNEMENKCDVKYSDIRGKTNEKKDVLVFSYNKSVIDWFPKINDKVLLQETDSVLYIVGPGEINHANLRSQIKLENDIFSDSFISGMGGYVF